MSERISIRNSLPGLFIVQVPKRVNSTRECKRTVSKWPVYNQWVISFYPLCFQGCLK